MKKPRYLNKSAADYSSVGLRRAVSASMARRSGKLFEDELELACDMYRRQGKAIFARAHPPVGGPPGQMFYIGKGQTDFTGQAFGVPVAFDAKSVSDDPASWRYPQRDIFQAEFLRDWKRAGGISFVLLKTPNVAYILFDVDTLAAGGAIKLRPEKRRGPKASEKVERFVPFIRRVPVAPVWDFYPKLKEFYDGEQQRATQSVGGSDTRPDQDGKPVGERV